MNRLELLAPACSYEGLVAAINAGADAVYIGGQKFGARAYADSTNEDTLVKGIEYAHLRGKQVYLTVNTLLKNTELHQLYDYLKAPYEAGLDAVIVQDLGVLKYIRKQFPGLDLHASTQMTITDHTGFSFLEKLGVTRVVPSRELSIQELDEIHRNTSLEIEAFIHGALCYSYSGQCLLSSIIGGRSGNRGRCAQPCRLPYGTDKNKQDYLLSLKDLCTIDAIPELVKAGVVSFKIEGRMKRPEYAAGVVEIYRKALDGKKITQEDRTQLLNLYSRSGNCTGYLKQHNSKDMITIKSPSYRTGEDALFDRIHKDYLQEKHSIKISGCCTLLYDQPSIFTVYAGDVAVTVEGDAPGKAQNRPLEADDVKKRLSKTGETDFVFSDLEVILEDGLFLPVQSLNSLKRNALDRLKEALLENHRRVAPAKEEIVSKSGDAPWKKPEISVLITSLEQINVAIEFPEITDVYLDTAVLSLKGDLKPYYNALVALQNAGKRIFLALPYIFRQKTKKVFQERFFEIFVPELNGCLIRNWEEFSFLQEELPNHTRLNYELRSDSNLYCFNHMSKEVLLEHHFKKLTLPVELNQKELKHLADQNTEWIVYSHLPLMVSAQCIRNTTTGCSGKSETLTIKDRMKKDFYVRNDCNCCYNLLFNGTPMVLWDKNLSAGLYRFDFHIESPDKMRQILNSALSGKELPKDFTRGHFNRGVE